MDDAISREQAIKATWQDTGYTDPFNVMTAIRDRIKQLPPIQPEIVRCEYCKHRDPEDKKCDCGHDILWQLPRRNDWFCADGER